MRPIDADYLLERLDKCDPLNGIGLEPVMAVRDIKALISVIPTVDAVPAAHGKWKAAKAGGPNYPFWDSKCSLCGYTTSRVINKWHYCPVCGAKMDEQSK